ncbi:HlyD family secretion protein [Pseudomonas rubra]|uniref:HlyD family secretion protein n=1 Tax=Pseudomonas rubra TaxID=2942627 RepID=A0ABT5P665_9PSED|nr:HlyD family secretion protein [Pseudomonas rubra]MDD1013563.1 HlyD family secretion protein [Pseudomonas rubra]MDD1040119.1 HlyD family secretion protein [Pseudomonas rubra]MDD1155875.1 HlyD family secretion protein [Pseudomonas rubra]
MGKPNYLKLAVCSAVIGGLALLGWQRWEYARQYVSTDNAEVEGIIVPIRARLSGTVVNVPVQHNSAVASGDLLLQLRDDEYLQQSHKAQAALDGLRAATGSQGAPGLLDSQARSAAANSQAAAATIGQLAAGLEQARSDYQRAQRLAVQGVLSHQELEAAKARFAALGHQLQGARNNARAAAQGSLAQQAALNLENFRIEAAQADLELSRIRLQDTRLHAPLSGIVADKHVEPGQFVVAGQKLLSLVATEQLWVVANFKETQIGRVRVGQPARITLDAFPDTVFLGRVQSLVPATGSRFSLLPQENASGNFTKVVQRLQARIELEQVAQPYQAALRQGMSALVEVDTADEHRL